MGTAHKFSCHGGAGLHRKSRMFGKQRMDRVTHDLSDADFFYCPAERKCECREIFSRAGNERLRKTRGIIQTQSQNFIACCLMERRCELGGEQWRKKPMRRRKTRGIIQTQSQNFFACCLMERRCDHGGEQWRKKPMRRRKKEESYNPSRKISLPAVLWKEGVTTEVINGGRSPCGGE